MPRSPRPWQQCPDFFASNPDMLAEVDFLMCESDYAIPLRKTCQALPMKQKSELLVLLCFGFCGCFLLF